MSGQRRQSSVRATSPETPDQHKAPAKVNRKKSKEQRDHHTNDIKEKPPERVEDEGALKRGSRTRQSKKEKDPRDCESEDKPRETTAPKAFSGGTESINRQSKKHRELSNKVSKISESKSEEKLSAACRRASVPNKANNAGENDRQDSAKSKPQQTAKSKSGEKTAQTRQKKKQGDPSKLGREESLESSESKSEENAPPGLNARSSDRKKKSTEKTTAVRGLSVDDTDTLGKVLRATIEKLKIKKYERSNASSCVNDITDKVIAHLKQNTIWCTDIERLRTGSYYENVKVSVAV